MKNVKENNGCLDVRTLSLNFPEAEMAVSWKSRVHLYEEDPEFWNNILHSFRQQI